MALEIALLAGSLLGILFLLVRNIPKAAAVPNEEIDMLFTEQGSIFSYISKRLREITSAAWFFSVRPVLFSFIVKAISRVRILTLRLEQKLLKVAADIRSRSSVVPRPSDYWQEIYHWKSTATEAVQQKVRRKYTRRKTIAKKSVSEEVPVVNMENSVIEESVS